MIVGGGIGTPGHGLSSHDFARELCGGLLVDTALECTEWAFGEVDRLDEDEEELPVVCSPLRDGACKDRMLHDALAELGRLELKTVGHSALDELESAKSEASNETSRALQERTQAVAYAYIGKQICC